MKITVIDFETANRHRASACAIGIAVIEAGEITARVERLIKPPKGYGWFIDEFISIHGITHKDVFKAPGFDTVYHELRPHFENALLAAHNAPFDMHVLHALFSYYWITFSADYLCTLALARQRWPHLSAYDLQTVANHLGVQFNHHAPGDDAYAAAQIIRAVRTFDGVAFTERLQPFLHRLSV